MIRVVVIKMQRNHQCQGVVFTSLHPFLLFLRRENRFLVWILRPESGRDEILFGHAG